MSISYNLAVRAAQEKKKPARGFDIVQDLVKHPVPIKIKGNSNDPEILVPGFGKLTRPLIQRKIKKYLDDIVKESKTLDSIQSLRNILYSGCKSGVLKVLLETEIAEMEKEKNNK